MATIALSTLGTTDTGTPSGFSSVGKIQVRSVDIDLADAVTEKGSALAQGDVIQALVVPAETLVLGGGIKVLSVMTGTSTDATIDVGITGGTVDAFVDGFDLDAAAANATSFANPMEIQYVSANDTIDIKIVTQTGTITGGVIRVIGIFAEVGDEIAKRPGRAALGS